MGVLLGGGGNGLELAPAGLETGMREIGAFEAKNTLGTLLDLVEHDLAGCWGDAARGTPPLSTFGRRGMA